MLHFGLLIGWVSPLQPSLQSDDSPLGEDASPLTDEEISWIGSLPSVSLMVASPLFGYLLNKIGRKKSMFISIAPNIVAYILLIFANNVYMIYVARLILGFCACGGFSVAPIYISEICEPKYRGMLCGSIGAYIKTGIILSFALGGFTSYNVLNVTSLMFAVLYLLFYVWMPESPVYLVMKNQKEEAKNALVKLFGNDYALVEKEVLKIENLMNNAAQKEGKFTLKNFITSKTIIKALLIVCGVCTVQMMCGYPAVVRYTVDIILDSGTSMSAYLAAILIALAQFLSAAICASILDRIGRKKLLLYSTVIITLAQGVLTAYLFMKRFESMAYLVTILKFLPTACLIIFIAGFASGYSTVPFVLVPELFSPETRATANAILNVWVSALEFLVAKMFLTINNWIGLDGSFFIFWCSCALGIVFVICVVFETRGLEFEEIHRKLEGRKDSKNLNCTEKGNVHENELSKLGE